ASISSMTGRAPSTTSRNIRLLLVRFSSPRSGPHGLPLASPTRRYRRSISSRKAATVAGSITPSIRVYPRSSSSSNRCSRSSIAVLPLPLKVVHVGRRPLRLEAPRLLSQLIDRSLRQDCSRGVEGAIEYPDRDLRQRSVRLLGGGRIRALD